MNTGKIVFALVSCCFSVVPALADTVKASDPKKTSITVYRSVGVVKEEREFDLVKGTNHAVAEDVSPFVNPDSILFKALEKPDSIQVEEQSFLPANLSPSEVFTNALGKTVTIRPNSENGQSKDLTGILVRTPDSGYWMLKIADQYVLGTNGLFSVPAPNTEYTIRPMFSWKLNATESRKENCEIVYLVNNLTWSCSYVAVIDSADKSANLESWVRIHNGTGTDFKHAKLEVVSGDPRQTHPVVPRVQHFAMEPTTIDNRHYTSGRMANAQAQVGDMSEQLEEYHLYKFPQTYDLPSSDTKQIALFTRSKIPLQKKFVADSFNLGPPTPEGGQIEKVQIDLELTNDEKSELGLPMPSGNVNVYKNDQDGNPQFVGSDSIRDTAVGETIRWRIGDAYDLIAERKDLAVQQDSKRVQKRSFQIDLRNHKDKEETITVVEHANGDWKINSSSHPYVKKNSTTFEFAVKVGANSEETLTYEIQTKSR